MCKFQAIHVGMHTDTDEIEVTNIYDLFLNITYTHILLSSPALYIENFSRCNFKSPFFLFLLISLYYNVIKRFSISSL